MHSPDVDAFAAVGFLILESILAVYLGSRVKRGVIPSPAATLLPTICFLLAHLFWWLSRWHDGSTSVPLYLMGSVASVAFLFGVTFMCGGCLTLRDQSLCIDSDNRLFRIVKRLPISFEGNSLCSISWIAAILLFFLPVACALLGVLGFIVSVVICGITGQKLWPYFTTILKCRAWPYTWMQFTHGWVPKGPLIYVLGVTTLNWFVRQVLATPYAFTEAGGILLMGFGALLLMATAIDMFSQWLLVRMPAPEIVHRDVRFAYEHLEREESFWRVFAILDLFWQVFRQRYCPKIEYCCTTSEERVSSGGLR